MRIYREIVDDILPWLGKEKILILKGARQTGKTTILKYLKGFLEENKKGSETAFFSMDAELGNTLFENPKLLIRFIREQYAGSFLYLFLDEFQYLDNAGMFLKVIYDELKSECQLIVSGSSSLEITKNSEFLTGRKLDFHISTLSFTEYAAYKTDLNLNKKLAIEEFSEIEKFDLIYGAGIRELFSDYIIFGGYPELAITAKTENKKLLLKELITTYIRKDVSGFLRINNISGFNNLLSLLLEQHGNIVNKSEISATLSLGHDTVNKFFDILEGTYVISFLKPFYKNSRKELTKMPKVYAFDTGLIAYATGRFSFSDYSSLPGALIENFVYRELLMKKDCDKLNFYRTVSKSEIDFIISCEDKLIPLEVKFSGKESSFPRSIRQFNLNYPNIAKNIVATRRHIAYEKENNCYYIPVYLIPFIRLANNDDG